MLSVRHVPTTIVAHVLHVQMTTVRTEVMAMTKMREWIAGIAKMGRIIAAVPIIIKVIEVTIDSVAIARKNLADSDSTAS